jgi:arylsulfatase A-like enzyme
VEGALSPGGGARARPLLIALSALVVPVLCLSGDLAARGAVFPRAGAGMYAAGALLSLLVWGLAMEAARHPRRAVRAAALTFLAFTAAFGVGLQIVARAFTHAYLGRRALLLALGIPDIGHAGYITHNAARIGGACLAPAAIVVGVALVRARWLGPRARWASRTAAAAGAAVIVTVFAPFAVEGFQCLPPDVLLLNGTGGPLLYAFGLEQRPRALPVGAHEALPATATAPVAADAPSIVLILGESVGRAAVCLSRAPGCDRSPRVDEAAPSRIGYARAFSTASCTELASTALWTGLPVTSAPEVLSRAPLVWDWARARGYRTAYLTSQNLLFQQSDQFLRGSRIDRLREARDRVADAHIDDGSPDEDTTAEALDFLEAAGGPALVVVHHANTHAPYRQTPGFTPHPGDAPHSRYRNSLAHNDAILGDLLTRLRRGPRGQRTVVVYLSDHGEAWGEHGSYFHSFDLYAEQIDVPLWIDAPPGVLPDAVMDRLRRDAPARPVSIGDVTATLVDLTGGLDEPAFRARAEALSGTSLLREPPARRDVLLWNCPPTRECAAEAFGTMSYPRKLHYVGHEQRYACHDVEADPAEVAPLPASRCADLFPLLDRAFGARAR